MSEIIRAVNLNMGDKYKMLDGVSPVRLALRCYEDYGVATATGYHEMHPFAQVERVSCGPACEHGPVEFCEHDDCESWPTEEEAALWEMYMVTIRS